MATEAQTNANRQNAEKSTGPRTAEGKAAVSQNALKHGLFSSETVVNGEDQAEFDLYREAMIGEMWPVGVIESSLAERIVSLSWRLRRTERMQNQALNELLKWLVTPSPIQLYAQSLTPPHMRTSEEDIKCNIPEPKMALGRVARRDWGAGDKVLERLMMYEQRIESSMYKTMNKLKQFQLIRRIEKKEADKRTADTSPAQDAKDDLKKQSQFAPALMGAPPSVLRAYAKQALPDWGQNKAKQSQFEKLTGPADREGGCEAPPGRKIVI